MKYEFDFCKNHLSRIKCNEISCCLNRIKNVLYKLRKYNCNDEFQCVDFNSNEIHKIKIYQHKRSHENRDEFSKCHFDVFVENKKIVYFFCLLLFDNFVKILIIFA